MNMKIEGQNSRSMTILETTGIGVKHLTKIGIVPENIQTNETVSAKKDIHLIESANGTFVNNKKIEPRRYVELLERDVVKFGFSQRDYVLLHENSKDDAQDDDNQEPAVATTDHIKQEKRVKQEAVEDGE